MQRASLGIVVLLLAAGCEGEPPLTNGLSAADHAAYFPIDEAAPHALNKEAVGGPISCAGCHAGTNTFKEFLCLSCHQLDQNPTLGEAHGTVGGYLPQDLACFACHPTGLAVDPNGGGGGANHSLEFFPIDAADAHGGPAYSARIGAGLNACSACHASVDDRTVTLCAQCHAADATPLADTHAQLQSSFVDNSTACKECHSETPINPYMTPLTQHVAIQTDHHAASCKDCHQVFAQPPKQWAIDFAQNNCVACHLAGCTIANPAACLE